MLKGHHGDEKQNFVLRGFERMFEAWLAGYAWALDKVIKGKAIMLLVTLATIAGTIWLYIAVPKGFFPTEDTGYIIGITEGKTDIAYAAMAEHQRKVADIVIDIAEASKEQSLGIAQVNQAIAQMDDVTQRNAALVEEAAAATQMMSQETSRLIEAVSVFKVKHDQGAANGMTSPQRSLLPLSEPVSPVDASTRRRA